MYLTPRERSNGAAPRNQLPFLPISPRFMIGDDIRLAQHLHRLLDAHPEFEALSCGLSITTFRYVPLGISATDADLDRLNAAILTQIENGGEAFVSNAVVNGKFALRACIVNFRTSLEDVEALPGIVARLGRELQKKMGFE